MGMYITLRFLNVMIGLIYGFTGPFALATLLVTVRIQSSVCIQLSTTRIALKQLHSMILWSRCCSFCSKFNVSCTRQDWNKTTHVNSTPLDSIELDTTGVHWTSLISLLTLFNLLACLLTFLCTMLVHTWTQYLVSVVPVAAHETEQKVSVCTVVTRDPWGISRDDRGRVTGQQHMLSVESRADTYCSIRGLADKPRDGTTVVARPAAHVFNLKGGAHKSLPDSNFTTRVRMERFGTERRSLSVVVIY